jgi:hypothetical protein
MRRDMKRLRREGKLNAAQWTYASPNKPVEEFYDTSQDPHQINNLAGSADHQQLLGEFRERHRQWTLRTRDLGFLPESDAWRRSAHTTPWDVARDPRSYPLKRILHTADLVGHPEASAEQVQLLSDDDPAVRYWAVIGLRSATESESAVDEALRRALDDQSPPVRIAAAAALAARGETEPAVTDLIGSLEAEEVEDVLHAIRSLQLIGVDTPHVRPAIEKALKRSQRQEASGASPLWMFVRFSAEAALEERQ